MLYPAELRARRKRGVTPSSRRFQANLWPKFGTMASGPLDISAPRPSPFAHSPLPPQCTGPMIWFAALQ